MRIEKKLLLMGLALSCLLGAASSRAHAERKASPSGGGGSEARFELAAPGEDSLGKKKEKETPAPTYKPIKGVRLTAPNQTARAEKEGIERDIRRQERQNRASKASLKREKSQLRAYRAAQSAASGTCGVLVDNGKGNAISRHAPFDGFLAGIGDYGVLDAEALIGLCWDQCLGGAGFGSGPESSRMPGPQASGLSYSESYICGARAVDVGAYLSRAIQGKESEISSLRKALKSGRKTLARLKGESGRICAEDIVFNSEDVTEPSNITAPKLREALAGTELERYADTYVEIERRHGINAIAICALSALESAWGTSRRAREDHNYTGYGVYSDSAVGINAASGEENLMTTARHLARNYLSEGDTYYHGKGLDGINRCYAASRTWAYGIEEIGCRIMRRL